MESNVETIINNVDVKALAEKGEGKFLSYGYDKQFFFIQNGNTYVNRGTTYELLGGNKNGRTQNVNRHGDTE